MRESCRLLVISIAISAFVISGSACSGGNNADDTSNYQVREAIIKTMGSDQVLELEINDMVQKIKANQLDLQTGLNDMVDRNQTLISLIKTVSDPEAPPDPNLARAQKKMGDYLRNRVHQFESTMEVTSITDLEAAYSSKQSDLEKELNEIRNLLLEYDPELKKAQPR